MNNEETIIAQPQEQEKKQEKKGGKGKVIAATAAASTVGGVVGGAGAAAAMNYATQGNFEAQDAEEQVANEPEVKVEEQPATAKPEQEDAAEPERVAVAAKVDEPADAAEPDYTNHGNADPVVETTPEATAQPALNTEESTPEVQVLGVYENVTEEGVHQTAAVLTNGTEIAAVVDVDGDGMADLLAVDENHNQQLDEGEVYDFSDQNVHMSAYEQAYLAQQQELEQQQMDDMAYNASDEAMADYDNTADPGEA